ncbi:MAG: glycosyltransferase family 2 protein [Candidatus Pacearchaeota archaeon]
MTPKLSIVIVTYNPKNFFEKCIESIFSSSFKSFEIIVIDNNSKISNSLNKVLLKYPKIKFIQNKKNVGFAKANNQGIKLARGKYILILNPDVILKKDTLLKSVNFMKKNKQARIMGCKLKNKINNKIEDSARKFPTLKELFFRRFLFKKSCDYPLMKISKPIQVDWVCGGFLFMRNKYLFDENYFLYFEDVDLCRRVGNVFYNPNIEAIHTPQRKSKKNLKLFLIHLKSMIYYFKKWGWKFY